MASLLTHTELVMFELRVSPGSPLKQEVHGHSHCGLQLGEERSGPLHTAQSPLVLSEGRVPIHKGVGPAGMCLEEVAQWGTAQAPLCG